MLALNGYNDSLYNEIFVGFEKYQFNQNSIAGVAYSCIYNA